MRIVPMGDTRTIWLVTGTVVCGCVLSAAAAGCQATVSTAATVATETLGRDAASVVKSPAVRDQADKAATGSAQTPAPELVAPAAEAVLVIDDPSQLARLPVGGDLAGLVFGIPGASTRDLRASKAYRSVFGTLRDRTGDFGTSTGSSNSAGAISLPTHWLSNTRTSFRLVAISNRIDRRDFGGPACGETRLVYRLGYTEPKQEWQALPVAFNVIFAQGDDGKGCVDQAQGWMVPAGKDAVAWLSARGGPLAPKALTADSLLAIETNVRTAEWQDGSAQNELRAFRWDQTEGRFADISLEFEPGYKQMYARHSVRAALDAEGLATVERGAGRPPKEMSSSWADVSNPPSMGPDPFGALWLRATPEDLDLPDTGLVSTKQGLTHRLRGMSCSGCHEARSVAGFHLPGQVGDLRGGASAHLLTELPWRKRYVEALAVRAVPDARRQLHDEGHGSFGARCSVADSPIEGRSCAAGLKCEPTPEASFGTCLPEGYEGPGPCARGSTCDTGPWFRGGFERHKCSDETPCGPLLRATDLYKCMRSEDRWACARDKAQARMVRMDPCEDQSQCREGYSCGTQASGGAVCVPDSSFESLRLIGHAPRLR